MALITPGTSGRATPYDLSSLAAASGGGDTFTNDGQTYFVIKNGDGSDHTVTFSFSGINQGVVDGVTPTAVARTVTAGHTAIFGPFPSGLYNDASSLVHVTYSAVTSVTVGAFKAPPAG
jgi:hypothetical protein